MTNIDTNLLDNIAKETEKKYKIKFRKGSEVPEVHRIPFLSPELNLATGGGIPLGRISRLWGEESSGKSTNSLLLARNAQNIHLYAENLLQHPNDKVKKKGEELLELFPNGMTVCWYDIEGSFDPVFAKKLGVDIDKLEIFEDKRIEVVGETLQAALSAAHLHIIDSTSGGSSVDELKNSILKWQRGLKPRAWNKVLDRFEASIDKQENAIVFIDQVRVDMTTGSLIVPGGRKMRHASSMTIQLKQGGWLFRTANGWTDAMPQKDDSLTSKSEPEGIELLAYVEKSRVGQGSRRAVTRFDKKNSTFDTNWELAKIAEWFGVAEKSGSWFQLPDGSKVQGANGIAQALNDNLDFKTKLLEKIELYIVENP